MRSRLALAGLLVALLLAGACDGRNQQVSKASPARDGSHHHEHIAPHGGTVVVLGDEIFHLEVVHNPSIGRLTLYVLDGHLEDFIRLPATGIETLIVSGQTNRTLSLAPVAQGATGETIGNTSQFAAEVDWLKTAELNGVITSIEIRGQSFTNIAFRVGSESKASGQKNH